MLADSKLQKERHAIITDKINQEKTRIQNEYQAVEASFVELRSRFNQVHDLNEQYRNVSKYFIYLIC